jgi:hypothetical protein
MTRRNARIVAKYLREAGWQERAIGAATTHTGARAVTGYATLSDKTNELGRWRDPRRRLTKTSRPHRRPKGPIATLKQKPAALAHLRSPRTVNRLLTVP